MMMMMMEDKEIDVYRKIRELKKGNLVQRKQAIKCEKILADECSKKNLDEKLDMVIKIISSTE